MSVSLSVSPLTLSYCCVSQIQMSESLDQDMKGEWRSITMENGVQYVTLAWTGTMEFM